MTQTTFDQIIALLSEDFPETEHLHPVLADVEQLYDGHWPEYEPCKAPYHTYHHALDVTLASLRMASGWNQDNQKTPLSPEAISTLVIGSLFHDSGYIKDKGDHEGLGGKYSFNHTSRSRTICASYFKARPHHQPLQDLVLKIIETTDFGTLPNLDIYTTDEQCVVAKIVATADLIAQMADLQYIDHLKDLYTEFAEAYEFHGKDTLKTQGVQVFDTFNDLLSATTTFYQNIVLPRLEFLGRMDQYLITYFGENRNPYLENIIANLSAQMQAGQVKWQRLGEILQDLNLVSKDTIDKALATQKEKASVTDQHHPLTGTTLQDRLFRWANHNPESSQLGDILMQMNAVNPTTLRQGILSQLIPESLLTTLSRKELIFLLHISMVIQNTKQDPWVFNQAMQMINEALDCTKTALYLAYSEKNELVCALFAGGQEPPKRVLSMDKGLSGWVYSHGRTAFLQKGMIIAHDNTDNETKISEDIGSLLGIPLYISGSLIGVLELSGKNSGYFAPHDADIMTVVAHILAGLLQTVSQDYAQAPSHD